MNTKRIYYLLLVFLCYAISANGAEIVRYVDTGSDAGGDGTTALTSESAPEAGDHAYQSLNQWEAAEETNLDTANNTHTVHCNRTNGGAMDILTCVITGWTTSATDYITVIADDFPAGGVYDNTKYVLHNNNDLTAAMQIREDFVRVRKLQVLVTEADAGQRYGIYYNNLGAGCDLYVDSCIFKGVCSGTGVGVGVYVSDADATVTVYNCITTDFVSGADAGFRGFYVDASTNVYFYNCTSYGNYSGISRGGGTVTAKNCAVGINTDDFTGAVTMDYIVSDDNHAGDCANYHAFPTNGANDWSLDFATPGTNFTLLATAANLIDDGLADVFTEDDDIMDTGRPQGAAWDIGAFEYVAAAPSGSQIIMISGIPIILIGCAVYTYRKAA